MQPQKLVDKEDRNYKFYLPKIEKNVEDLAKSGYMKIQKI